MSFRPLIKQFNAIVDGDMSAGIVGEASIIQNISMLSYAFSWDGSGVDGEISVEVSNDYAENADGSVKNAGTWATLTLQYNGSSVTEIAINTDTGNGMVDIFQTGAYAIRPRYTRIGGTGTLQAVMNGKVA